MIEYAKVILPKVSFSKDLFRKELLKCISWVDESDLSELRTFCYENFSDMYPEILSEVFSTIAA
jgi:hypothetical protein